MVKIIHTWLDLLFPATKEEQLLRTHSSTTILKKLRPRQVHNCTTLTTYSDPLIRTAIIENKFHNSVQAQILLAALFTTWIETLRVRPIHIVTIPLHPHRLRTRGYNQIETVIRRVQKQPDVIIHPHILTRVIDTAPQTSANRDLRLTNMKRAFTVNEREAPHLSTWTGTVILLDDVITTGATMQEARATLAPHLPATCTLRTVALAH